MAFFLLAFLLALVQHTFRAYAANFLPKNEAHGSDLDRNIYHPNEFAMFYHR